eukprot:scaffold199301_cov22-Prasinocladus_malaysianus.AAC.1
MAVAVGLELIVRGYKHRESFALAALLGSIATLSANESDLRTRLQAAGSLLATGAFTLLPIMQKPQIPWMVASAALPTLATPWLLRPELNALTRTEAKQWKFAF